MSAGRIADIGRWDRGGGNLHSHSLKYVLSIEGKFKMSSLLFPSTLF